MFDTDTTMTVIQRLAITQLLTYKERNKLFSASEDGTLCLWNGETGDTVASIREESALNCLAITPSNDLLMTGWKSQ